MWLLWDWMGIDHWEFHGMALWAMHWDPMDLHWGCSLRIPWECSRCRSLGSPHVAPMEFHLYWSKGAPWLCFMGNAFRIPHVGIYGIGWGLIIGNSMEWLYGQCIGIPWTCIGAGHWDFHGSALWVGHWDAHMVLPWNCMATAP